MTQLAGVHRIQRVPQNSRHRQTSTVTVAIVELSQLQTIFDESDCELESYRGSGAGGQHRNVTDSAVRITHAPSGLVAKSESQRSWWQNKEAAMKELRRRLEDAEASAEQARTNGARVEQIGIGDRPSHDWTWCGYRNTVTQHSSGKSWPMDRALKGKFI